ncbi:MAG: universal stress protein [Acidobacteriota bacterium]
MPDISRLLVPTDFSAPSDLALDYAINVATRFGASVHLLHVLEDPVLTTAYPDGYFAELPALRQQMTDEAERRLALAAEKCRKAKLAVTSAVAVGKPHATIVREAAGHGADLIVMGTHGRSGFAHLVLGSVAERVLRSASCPVLTIRHPEAADAEPSPSQADTP